MRAEAVVVPHVAARVPVPIEPATVLPAPAEAPGRGESIIRNKSSAWRSAATAGLVGALLSMLPLGFLVGFPLAGFLSVLFYRRRTWGDELSPSAGLRLGLWTGMIGSAIFVVLVALQTVASHRGSEIQQGMIDTFWVMREYLAFDAVL